MSKMNDANAVYADYDEKYLKYFLFYGKASDSYVYSDSGCTEKVDKDTLLNACMFGVVIYVTDTYYRPLFFKKESDGSVSVTFATTIGASNSAATTLYSKEHEED